MIRRYAGSVLAFEAIVIILAIPVAINVAGAPAGWALAGGLALVVACGLVAGRLDRPWGVPAGWVIQMLVLLSGLAIPIMFILGAFFTGLWYAALRLAKAHTAPTATPSATGGREIEQVNEEQYD